MRRQTRRGRSRKGPPTMSSATTDIVINGRFLTQAVAGVQRFAIETVKAMDNCLGHPDYSDLKSHVELQAPRSGRDFPLRNIRVNRNGFTSGYVWEQIELPLRTIGRLQLNLCMLGSVLKRRQIIVVHDTSTKAFPQGFSRAFVTAYDLIIPNATRMADLVVSVSDFSRREMQKYYGLDASQIPICYEGSDHIKAQPADDSVIDRLNLRDRPYFLGVGIYAYNKNLTGTFTELKQANLPGAVLVATGRRRADIHGTLAVIEDERLVDTGHISDAELRALYEHALALVYPSTYEGFGLPPLEAMQCGCPAIVSDHEVLVEIGGEATLRCGVNDVDSLAAAMKAVYDDPALRASLKEKGLAHAERYTWDDTARILLDLCRQVAASNAR